jgi:hypothetical protein
MAKFLCDNPESAAMRGAPPRETAFSKMRAGTIQKSHPAGQGQGANGRLSPHATSKYAGLSRAMLTLA